MIKVKNLSFSYKNKEVFNKLDLTLNQGKFITILGPNGSGKTTLLSVLSGQADDFSGQVEFENRLLSDYTPIDMAKSWAIIRQKSDLNFPYTCLEIVEMGRYPHTRAGRLSDIDKSIVYESMMSTDTLQFATKLVTEISGGEFQRVMLAKALAQQPKLLYLDEAFSAMDIAHTVKALKLIKKIMKEKGLTVVAVMHDINLAYSYSDEICLLNEGQLKAYGETEEVLNEDHILEVFGISVTRYGDNGFLINHKSGDD